MLGLVISAQRLIYNGVIHLYSHISNKSDKKIAAPAIGIRIGFIATKARFYKQGMCFCESGA